MNYSFSFELGINLKSQQYSTILKILRVLYLNRFDYNYSFIYNYMDVGEKRIKKGVMEHSTGYNYITIVVYLVIVY